MSKINKLRDLLEEVKLPRESEHTLKTLDEVGNKIKHYKERLRDKLETANYNKDEVKKIYEKILEVNKILDFLASETL